ncbi:MAG TPA: hypothetical protein V6D48_19095, partial [Oculatellaceae cyanobacterium]
CKSRFLAVGAKHLRPDLSVKSGFLSANASPSSDLCKRSNEIVAVSVNLPLESEVHDRRTLIKAFSFRIRQASLD